MERYKGRFKGRIKGRLDLIILSGFYHPAIQAELGIIRKYARQPDFH